MAKKSKRSWKKSTILLTVQIGDGSGWIYKDRRPINEALPPLLTYVNQGLQIDLPKEFIGKNGNKQKHRKRKPKPRENGL